MFGKMIETAWNIIFFKKKEKRTANPFDLFHNNLQILKILEKDKSHSRGPVNQFSFFTQNIWDVTICSYTWKTKDNSSGKEEKQTFKLKFEEKFR